MADASFDDSLADELGRRMAALTPADVDDMPDSVAAAQNIVIGRSLDCDVVIDLPVVSRRHVEIRSNPPSVRDLGSFNGTWVDRSGERIELVALNWTALQPGDVVSTLDVELHRVTSN